MSNFREIVKSDNMERCPRTYVLALTDTLNVINGKWKLPIIASLLRGVSRFKDLLDRTEKITPRMLSKELKELEINGIVERKVYIQSPVLIEYHLTDSGQKLANVIDSMIDWGIIHRTNIITTSNRDVTGL